MKSRTAIFRRQREREEWEKHTKRVIRKVESYGYVYYFD
jgi:hypothetical protein